MLRVERLTKIFDNATDQIAGGIREASFALDPGTFFTLLGPSGCGKTTTLRCIAGLETPDDGAIAVNGRTLFDAQRRVNVPVEQRSVGMVFQSYAIWPHMTVAENVAFPFTVARHRRYSRAEIADGVRRALATVDLDGFQERSATRLSGGQQQRVALARFVGATNLLPGRLIGAADGRGEVEVLGGRRIRCLVPPGIASASAVSVSIRPESIQLVASGTSAADGDGNCLAGRISGVTFL